jgi:hypothetical protein
MRSCEAATVLHIQMIPFKNYTRPFDQMIPDPPTGRRFAMKQSRKRTRGSCSRRRLKVGLLTLLISTGNHDSQTLSLSLQLSVIRHTRTAT